ncbi:MAG: hypothetical protein GY842_05535, partial [bacterium]|nr:hypothetical protein [bacterium]
MSALSDSATLTVEEYEDPTARILSPNGGELWLLSTPGDPPRTETITWEMSDNTHLCWGEVALLHSVGGSPYVEVPAFGGLPATFDEGPGCGLPGVQAESVEYTLPTEPPSGNVTSQYKIRLRVTDHAGNTTEVLSAQPFSIAAPNPDVVKTLILTNVPRMEAMGSASPADAADLEVRLQDLANHDDVKGFVVHLEYSGSLDSLYLDWDADPGDPAKANAVLFDPDAGIHRLVRQWLAAFPGAEYVIVVGDDSIIPLARIDDRTILLPEECYTKESCPDQDYYPSGIDLTPNTTKVGEALAANTYLSDDLLASRDPIDPTMIDEKTYIPDPELDLAIGRLVETPQEIIQAITVFLNQNGIVDLTDLDPVDGHKVLVTGYDFLIDSAKKGCRDWKGAFGVTTPCPGDDLDPVDGQLISRTWGEDTTEARRQALRTHLGGNGGERYAITNLNGHATHYEEGVPITDPYDVEGLNAKDIYGPDACGSSTLGPLDLAGSVLYAAGCHAGLPVTGSCATDADHSLDLPQTMLWRGVQGYVANTGFGWGLVDGIGYGERLVDLLTNRFTDGGTLVMGKVVAEVKNAYYFTSARSDFGDPERLGPYAEKTVMQWTYFGFPMYAVKVGPTGAAPDRTAPLFQGPAREPGELPREEHLGAVRVTRELSGNALSEPSSSPSHLTRLVLGFDLSAPGLYTKYDASGDVLGDPADPIDPPDAGCPDPPEGESEGCYYTLSGLSTDAADLPIQPLLAYDSRLSETSLHGVLWKGGTYREEGTWSPVVARLASNLVEPEWNLAAAGRTIIIAARKIRPDSPGELDCTSVDREMSSIVVATGETLWSEVPETYDVERLYQDVDLEVFYFNNTVDGNGNCDRLGPELGDGPFNGAYHHAAGPIIEWAIPAADEAGVWRVVVVHTDNTVTDDHGAWVPLELTDDGTGTWRGSETFPGALRVTYVIQAIDYRGNVTWADGEMPDLPPSGVPLGIPGIFDVDLTPGRAYLSVALDDEQDPVMAGARIHYTIDVDNGGPDPAILPKVSLALDAKLTDPLVVGDGWTCGHAAGLVTCEREVLAPGPADRISVSVKAPAVAG